MVELFTFFAIRTISICAIRTTGKPPKAAPSNPPDRTF